MVGIIPHSLEDGLYGMVITLCKQKAETMPMEQAQEEVAAWLVQVAATLATMNKETATDGN